MNLDVFTIHLPHTLVGSGAVDKVGKLAKEFGAKKVLLVTDKAIFQAGLLDNVKQPLEKEGIEVVIVTHVEPDNPIEGAEKSARAAKEGGCDLIIGVGRGSVLDNAKVTSISAAEEDISIETIDSSWQVIGRL